MSHYFDEAPSVASRPRTVDLVLPDLRVSLQTDRGVFSPDGVDAGTKLLLLEAPVPGDLVAGPLLDLGCGYGPIAVSLAHRAPAATVWAVDVNERARGLAAVNAAGLRVRVVAPDDVPADVRFAGIWSNPPIRVGKPVLHSMLSRWLARLSPDGRAWLVVQKHLGSDSLQRWLESSGWPTTRLTSRAGYRVLEIGGAPGPAGLVASLPMGDGTVRNLVSDDDIRDALRSVLTAFLAPKDVTDEGVAWAAERWDRSRAWGAFDEDGLCGTARTFASRLRLPGLGDAPVSCLTSVTVLPTHTRRGHLSRMMRAQLDHAIEVGEVASLLVAAEWPIYGRYGYGPYSEWVEWEVDTSVASIVGTPVGTCRLVDVATLDKAASVVLARQQAATPGSIERPAWFLAMTTGADPRPGDKDEGRVRVVHYDADGEPDAFVHYDPKEKWDGMRPSNRLEVQELAAASPEAEREMWRYLADVDLVQLVKWGGSPTSVLRWCMRDGRGAHSAGRWDHIWARLLDVPACLSARSYSSSARVVLEVVDSFMGRGGRFVLDATPEGASCTPAAGGESADVTMDVAALGAGWVGGTDLRLAAAGGGLWAIDEHRVGVVSELSALLRWHQTPYCSTDF